MEDGVVAGVDLVPPVNVSGQQEGVQPRPHQVRLVGGRVSAKHRRPVPHKNRVSDADGGRRALAAEDIGSHLFR